MKLINNNQLIEKNLITAVITGNIQEVKSLLAKGVNPNSTNDFKSTAITLSITNNQMEICLELLKAGANPDIKNNSGLSANDIAKQQNHIEFVKLIETYRSKNKQQFKKRRFQFTKGMSTKRVHLEYREFPREHEFEDQYYNDTIDLLKVEIDETKKKLKKRDLGGADARTNEIIAGVVAKRIPRMEQHAKKPYYARLDIQSKNGDTSTYYLGSHGMTDDRVYAPQSRIGSLFAQKTLGKVHDKELGEVEVTLIRQFENDNGKIQSIMDKSWAKETGYVDPILMKRLNDNAKSKMNEIWETIQGEQDSVVRQGISQPIIVQGSAGSGKTVIALHRLSYLLYQYKELEEQKIMILGPSSMYLKYIQDALPHLDVGEIGQTTFENFCLERIPFEKYDYSLISFYNTILKGLPEQELKSSKLKGSLPYQNALRLFLEEYIKTIPPTEGIQSGNFSFTADRIRGLFEQFTEYNTVEVARNRIIENIKAEIQRYLTKIRWNNEENGTQRSKEINNKLNAFLQNWQLPNSFAIYRLFSTNLSFLKEHLPEVNTDILEEFAEGNKKNLDEQKVTVDDLPPLLEIEQWLTGKIGTYHSQDASITNQKFDYIVIDEAQDYSPYRFSILNSFMKPGRMMLLGDLGQSIYDFRGINDWKEATKALGLVDEDSYTYLELSTIYRSTVQIVQFANDVIRPFTQDRYTLSEPIGRDGEKPSIHPYRGSANLLSKIKSTVNQLKEKGFENIAIITRDWGEAAKVYPKIKKQFPEADLITKASAEYTGGVIVIPVYLTKGIEFDAVILTDASMEHYKDDDHNRKLLYVAITRALHQVYVIYFQDKLALPLLDVLDKKKADEVREEIRNRELEEKRQRELEAQRQKELAEQMQRALEQQLQKELEEQRLKELEELERLAVQPSKPVFLVAMENEFKKVLDTHQLEVNQLTDRILQLEAELNREKETVRHIDPGIKRDDSIVNLQKNALFHYFLGKDSGKITEFFNSLETRSIDERIIVQLSTLSDFLIQKEYQIVPEIIESIRSTLLKGTPADKKAINLFFYVSTELLLNTGTEVANIKEIFIGNFSLFSHLADTKIGDYLYDFLEFNFDFLAEMVLELSDLALLVKFIQLQFEYQMVDRVDYVIDWLFEEWSLFESHLTKDLFIKLLWYAFYFERDEILIEKAPIGFFDDSLPEVQLYNDCYDIMNGEGKGDISRLNKLKSFSPLERILLEEKINKLSKPLQQA